MSIVTSNTQWICFINGLEVPIIAASTTTQSGGLASAQVTMPYSPFISKLPKHTKITLFSIDLNKSDEPLLEFDGTIQGINWRQEKFNGNTGLFLMAQTDGRIWSEREKFNFTLDSGFSINRLMQTMQQFESQDTISKSAIGDPLGYILQSNNNDAGLVSSVFLTHTFDLDNLGLIYYVDNGFYYSKKGKVPGSNPISSSGTIDKNYYSNYIKKFYLKFNVVRKLCRISMPDAFKQAFKIEYNWKVVQNLIQSQEGKINFWNFITYICDVFGFEVYDIPDASFTTISRSNMEYLNPNNSQNNQAAQYPIMTEYIIKPKSPFGPIPYSNVIFPDQVLDKSFFKNYQNETTRVATAIKTFPGPSTDSTIGALLSGYSGPYIPDDVSYFQSFNIKTPHFVVSASNKSFLIRSDYEEEFGVHTKEIELPSTLARLLTSKPTINSDGTALTEDQKDKQSEDNENALQNMVNINFFTSYTEKVSFSLQVTPDVDVIPGASILVLDTNDDHMLAYCYGREKIWDKNGQQLINLKLMYPRHYSLQLGFASNYLNTMDPTFYKDTYVQDVNIYEQLIGCKTLPQDPNKTIEQNIKDLMTQWNDSNQNTSLLKSNTLYIRARMTYSQYQQFYGVGNTGNYYNTTQYNKMPEDLIIRWGYTNDTVAQMSALQWSYAENGYEYLQETDGYNTTPTDSYPPYYKPTYNELNTPGPIRVSPFIEGIVNCHNRYLMQIGNNIS
jgi:hypothetical protein